MRRVTVLAAVIVLLGAGVVAQTKRPMPPDVGPGRVAWFDISTTNLTQAKEFYGKLFDWTFGPVEGTDQAFDIVARGAAIGTLRGAEGQLSGFNGVVYIQVNDIQASCSKAKAAWRHDRARIPVQPAGRDRRHLPRCRSLRSSCRHVLENPDSVEGAAALATA